MSSSTGCRIPAPCHVLRQPRSGGALDDLQRPAGLLFPEIPGCDAALLPNNQEILDTVIQAYRIAEEVYIPVMVCYDGFVLSHTMMPVEIPTPKPSSPSCPRTSLTQSFRPTIRKISIP